MPTPFTVKDRGTVRDDILRTWRNGLIARGVANPQLGPGSSEYVLATAVGGELAVVGSNVQIKADAQMPDTATGSDLVRLAAQLGLAPRAAGPSTGYVTLKTSANTYIPLGAQLTDIIGLRYQVLVGGLYTNTAPSNLVPIMAIDKGTQTNHVAGDVLKWVATPAYADPTALVTAAGLTGGVDAEEDEALRARLLSRMQNPPNNANWNQIAAIAEASSTAVEKAFPYPAANGPSTVHIAVTAPAVSTSVSVPVLVSTSKNRDVDATILAAAIVPFIQGQLPEYVESTITTVTNVPNDVAIGLSIPASAAAVPAGPGGGWIDGTPWPDVRTTPTVGASVTAVTSTSSFRVNAPTAPANGSHICYLDPTTWTLYRAKVLTAFGSAGAYDITIDSPFVNVTTANGGSYIWPDCVNAQVYVNAILTAFAQMGPGEKTVANRARGYRHPVPALSWPYTLGPVQLRTLTNSSPEILDVQWIARTSSAAPDVPVVVTDPPNIFVPRRIGFYQL